MRNEYNEQFETVVSAGSTTGSSVPEPVEGTVTELVEGTVTKTVEAPK